MQQIMWHCGDVNVKTFAVPAFDTISTGFFLGQTANNTKVENHYFYVNTAPIKDDLELRKNNDGEGLVYVELYNGAKIIAVNSGYSLSFVKNSAKKILKVPCATDGSQFRSRDVFPEWLSKIIDYDYHVAKLSMHDWEDVRDSVPDMPLDVMVYADGYGNMKCTLDPEFVRHNIGKKCEIHIPYVNNLGILKNTVHKAVFTDGIFGVKDGELCVSVGSSGWQTNGNRIELVEIVKRGGSAVKELSKYQDFDNNLFIRREIFSGININLVVDK